MQKCKFRYKIPNPDSVAKQMEKLECEYGVCIDFLDLINTINNSSVTEVSQLPPSFLRGAGNVKECSGYDTEGRLLKIYVAPDGLCLSILGVDYVPT